MCSTAWSLSAVFGGDPVRVRDYLPGLHLDIQALCVQPLLSGSPPQAGLAHHNVLDWDRLDRTIWSALHASGPADTMVLEDSQVRCVIRAQGGAAGPDEPVAFTLKCQWPMGTPPGPCT